MLRFILWAAALLVGVVVALLTGIVRAFSPADAGAFYIVYSWSDSGVSGATLMNSDGANPRGLSDGGVPILHAACAPDGSALGYMAGDAIRVIRADGRDLTFPLADFGITPGDLQFLSLSNGGERLLISARTPLLGYHILLLDTASAAFTPLDGIGQYSIKPIVSPDGRRVAFIAGESYRFRHPQLYVVDLSTAALTFIAGQAVNPAWSPDGGALIWTEQNVETRFYAFIAIGDPLRDVYFQIDRFKDSNILEAVWTPDGRTLLYIAYVNGDERVALEGWYASQVPRVLLPTDDGYLLRYRPCALTFEPTRLLP
ncbi:MAG: hypothetical protein SGI73_02110 [Chloroflexota bacterium]|nr:hypothetical protein [Chloroflexota bacterium]